MAMSRDERPGSTSTPDPGETDERETEPGQTYDFAGGNPWEGSTPARSDTSPMATPHTHPGATETLTGTDEVTEQGPARGGRPSEPFTVPLEVPGYRIKRPLGHGGMGEVYLAERVGSTGIVVPCVVKTILPGQDAQARFRRRFLNEARIVAGLSHPNIVSILDVGEVDQRLYLVMEHIDGLDGRELLREARRRAVEIPLSHVLYILREALQGLHHAHSALDADGEPLNIVHRDVSPENLLLSRQGAVKLTDFGVAKALRATGKAGLAGKVHYFAPELFRGGLASVASDVFAMCVAFYELMTVRPLFDRRLSFHRIRDQVLSFDIGELLERDLTIPEGIESILLKGLASDPADRYPSALEMLEDVNDYVYESGVRLLDAHFAPYVERVLERGQVESRRSAIDAAASRGGG